MSETYEKRLKVNKGSTPHSCSINGLVEYNTFYELVQDVIKRGGEVIINNKDIFISNLEVIKGSLKFI